MSQNIECFLDVNGPSRRKKTSNTVTRRRAPKACLGCRMRKVRCDVSVKGSPCTNCTLDSIECKVNQHRRRMRLPHPHVKPLQPQEKQVERASADPPRVAESEPTTILDTLVSDNIQLEQAEAVPQRSPPSDTANTENVPEIPPEQELARLVTTLREADPENTVALGSCQQCHYIDPKCLYKEAEVEINPSGIFLDLPIRSETPATVTTPFASYDVANLSSNYRRSFVPFSSYHFVLPDVLWDMAQEDILYLESKGCIHLPAKPALDEFIRQYFLHVHPTLLLLNEGAFWALYRSPCTQLDPSKQIPLLVLQAMLFMASPFVPDSTLQYIGISSVQEARSCFYHRCKVLFHLDGARDNISKAQCALMLTYHATTIDDRTSNYWLATAIHFARAAEADKYDTSYRPWGDKITLKRLWWCCIIRDRIMALGLRRPIQIRPTDFDFGLQGLVEEDISDEIGCSEVYDASTKKVLSQLAVSLCELVVILNDILVLCYPTQTRAVTNSDSLCKDFQVLKDQASSLDTWYEISVEKFRLADSSCCMHKSLGLFINALSIYHFAAKVSLYSQIMTLSFSNPTSEAAGPYTMLHASDEINESLKNIVQSLKDLEHRDLAKYLPNTFVAFSVLPFETYLESRLLEEEFAVSSSQKDIGFYSTVLARFHKLYEMTESVLSSIGYPVENLRKRFSDQETEMCK